MTSSIPKPLKAHHKPIASMLSDGKLPFEVQTALGVTCGIVNYVRKKIGMPPFKPGAPRRPRRGTPEMKRIAREMKIAGFTYRQIGDHIGVSKQRAQQLLRFLPNEKAERCANCGVGNVKIEYHHEDYSKDEAIPLCTSCHRQKH